MSDNGAVFVFPPNPLLSQLIVSIWLGMMLAPYGWGFLFYLIYLIATTLLVAVIFRRKVHYAFGAFFVSLFGFFTGRIMVIESGSPIDD